ncbi:hypothetical protein IT568_08745 [bacterium]|nr:hypothetical protein [bacterium]
MNFQLYKLDKPLKNLLLTFICVLGTGVSVGLIFLGNTTNLSPNGTITRYNGTGQTQDEIQTEYPKPIQELLLTTHNHILGMSLFFFAIGLIFHFNTIVSGFWKSFLMIEPLISVVVTFGSIWLLRFVHPNFVYLTMISAILMYLCFYTMIFILIFELRFKK